MSKAYVIYFNTSDYPNVYSVREWVMKKRLKADRLIGTSDSLAEARNLVPDGYIPMPRDSIDDSVIVETWI